MDVILHHEQLQLAEFRSATGDLNLDEVTLVRFLRARNHDLRKAEEMLRKTMDWRESHEIHAAGKWKVPLEIIKDFRMYFSGLDNEGYPVYVLPLGRWDGRKILGQGLKEECVKFMYKTIELVINSCKEMGVTKFNMIVDNDGLNLWKVAHWDSVETAIRVIKDFEANYPETLLNAFLINTPTVFWQAFKFAKPVIAGNTLKKIHIFDSDVKKWQGALLEQIPKESLPNAYGGTAQPTDIHLME